MGQRDQQGVAGALEGLVLSDGGACYAIPTIVIERYRVAVEDLACLTASETAGADREHPQIWSVIGAIYVSGDGTGQRQTAEHIPAGAAALSEQAGERDEGSNEDWQ